MVPQAGMMVRVADSSEMATMWMLTFIWDLPRCTRNGLLNFITALHDPAQAFAHS